MTTDPAALAEKIQAIDESRAARAESASGPNYNVAPTTTITAGKATPAPPVGTALGQGGI